MHFSPPRELVLLTKKQPKANFSEIAKLSMDIKNLHQICCEGNAVVCVLGRVRFSLLLKLISNLKIFVFLK